MSRRHRRTGFRDRLIEMLEQRRLLSASVQAAPITGSLVGGVVTDSNHNFRGDTDDPGVGGVTVFIDANGNGRLDAANGSEPAELYVLTNSAGTFSFHDLPPGTYRVREIAPKGFEQFSQPFIDGVVAEGSTNAGNFQNTDYAVIDGTTRSDKIRVAKVAAGLSVTINHRAPQIFKHVAGVMIRSNSGEDRVSIDPLMLLPTHIDGGDGADTLGGGGGSNTIIGGQGDDSIKGGASKDRIDGGEGNDVIDGGDGDNIIDGGDGDDTLNGGGGIDSILGGNGNDVIDGGGGGDYLFGNAGNDVINGGDGWNGIQGGAGNDSIVGGNSRDDIDGGYGNDTINGGGESDYITARAGIDVVDGGDGDDYFNVEDSHIILDGGTGTDSVTYYGTRLPSNLRNIEHASQYVPAPPSDFPPIPLCFLTTAVVAWAGLADDGRELTLLRRFRDTYMRGLPEGPGMIRDYYAYAPQVVRAIETAGLGDLEWPCVFAMVQTAIRYIQAGRNAAVLRVYSAEYLRLKGRYVAGNSMGRPRGRRGTRARVLCSC